MQWSSKQNLVSSEYLHFSKNIEETEAELCIFYGKVLKYLYRSTEHGQIRQSLSNIRSYRNPDVEVHGSVEFDSKYDRCAYVLAYCIIHTIVMYDRFLDMLKTNPSMLKKIPIMKSLRFCILGGGPTFEAAAICKLLNRILVNCGPQKRPPLKVYVTVIDICAEWEAEAKCIVRSAQNEFCTNNNIEVNFSFIEADLTEKFSLSVREAIEKAHFVTMFKFLSEAVDAYVLKKVTRMIHEIIELMRPKSCLFYLDTSGGGTFNKLDKIIDGLTHTKRIYGSCLYNCHKLSPDIALKFSKCVYNIYSGLKCTNQTTISCSAWLKIAGVIKLKDLSLGIEYVPPEILEDLERHKCKEKPRKSKKNNISSGLKYFEDDL